MQDKIVERVRRLLALATSDNVNEAANAAAAAQKLMAEHRISEAMLAIDSGSDEDVEDVENQVLDVVGRRKELWLGILLHGLTRANGCEAYWASEDGQAVLRIVGATSDVQTCTYLYLYLRVEVERLCKAQGRKGPDARRFNASFKAGAASTLQRRILDAAKEQRTEQRIEAAEQGGVALMRIDSALARLDAKAERVKLAMPKTRKARAGKARDWTGFTAGERAARQISLDRGGPALGAAARGTLRG